MARQIRPETGQREARVVETVEMMRAGTFVRGKTYAELAAKWGLAEKYAQDVTAEAWRRYCAERSNPHELRSTALDWVYEAVEGARTDAVSPPEGESASANRKVTLEGAKILLAVAGPARSLPLPEAWPTMSPAEKWARFDEAAAQLEQIRAGMPPRDTDPT